MFKWLQNKHMVAQTRNTLQRLTDRDLKDIGLSRGDINRVAINWKSLQDAH